ncbi:hypothetical protein GW571_00715 [Clavibacter capsici]|uniref:Uncharacterized protein n=1 Tax=Clavibacter capsici TaxID=1874630 RepID=A0A0M4HC92_9MICO|nr:hypothetical protein [Clavibacter capsici]ALD11671.1 hypothetical protein AES38_00700 [Clavibacter capsici]QIS40782.1 hypothetical protein GW571_00715 [Clavibacter capsici]QIS43724.1 hypothetical protein GW570_00705 [Clavibacter capsici]
MGAGDIDEVEAGKVRTLTGISAFTLMLGLLIVGLAPDLSAAGGFRWSAPSWLYAGIFVLFGLAGLVSAMRAIRLRRRSRG